MTDVYLVRAREKAREEMTEVESRINNIEELEKLISDAFASIVLSELDKEKHTSVKPEKHNKVRVVFNTEVITSRMSNLMLHHTTDNIRVKKRGESNNVLIVETLHKLTSNE